MRRLLDDTRYRCLDRAARHGQAIEVDLSEDLEVLADPVRIRQALARSAGAAQASTDTGASQTS